MKLITFEKNNKPSYGVLRDQSIIDLGAEMGKEFLVHPSVLASGFPHGDDHCSLWTCSFTIYLKS